MGRTSMGAALLILALAGTGIMVAACTSGSSERARDEAREAAETAGERAREVGHEVGERTAAAAEQARQAIGEGTITGKIKAKMALDDTIEARDISVDTDGTIVTLTGSVNTTAQRDRALQLARETEGVKKVIDKLRVRE